MQGNMTNRELIVEQTPNQTLNATTIEHVALLTKVGEADKVWVHLHYTYYHAHALTVVNVRFNTGMLLSSATLNQWTYPYPLVKAIYAATDSIVNYLVSQGFDKEDTANNLFY